MAPSPSKCSFGTMLEWALRSSLNAPERKYFLWAAALGEQF
jgi:hypothetical protein